MGKLTKNQKKVLEKYDASREYTIDEATRILKDINYAKFDASVDVDVRLGVDPKKADQLIRGVTTLPHGTGKEVKVLVLCTPEKEQEAQDAGADHVGLDNYIKKIEGGWIDVDVIVTMPSAMAKVGKLGRVLGPRGLMPSPKAGTVTQDIGKAVKDIKAGKIDFKVDKFGIIHAGVGKISFDPDKIRDNVNEVVQTIARLKPSSAKGTYFKSINLSSTMSPGIKIDTNSIQGI